MPNNTYENLVFKHLQVQIHYLGIQARERKLILLGNHGTNHPDQEELHSPPTGSVPRASWKPTLGRFIRIWQARPMSRAEGKLMADISPELW